MLPPCLQLRSRLLWEPPWTPARAHATCPHQLCSWVPPPLCLPLRAVAPLFTHMNPHNTGDFQWAGVLVYFLSQAQVREGHLEHVAVKRKKMDGGMDG